MANNPTLPAKQPEQPASQPDQPAKPKLNRVQQLCDHDCAFACVAMLAGKTIEEVKEVAVTRFGHPRHGPYWITEDLILKLLNSYSWHGSSYKEARGGIAFLPDLAIGMVDYNPDTEFGRHVVFYRIGGPSAQKREEFILDPAYWLESEDKKVRTDIKGLPISWYIAVTPARPDGK